MTELLFFTPNNQKEQNYEDQRNGIYYSSPTLFQAKETAFPKFNDAIIAMNRLHCSVR